MVKIRWRETPKGHRKGHESYGILENQKSTNLYYPVTPEY